MINCKQLHVISFNCKSLNTKLGEFKLYLYKKKPHIVCLCEIGAIAGKEPNFLGYRGLWKHRQGGRGGGVGVLIKNEIAVISDQIVVKPNSLLEVQKVTIKMLYFDLDILNVYNPGVNVDVNTWNYYVRQMSNYSVIVGDFNAHHPMWSFNNKRNPSGVALCQLFSNSNYCLVTPPKLVTYVDFARGTVSTLDLCIVTSNLLSNSSVDTGPDIGSDHLPVEILINKQPIVNEIKVRPKWKLEGINWGEWASKLPEIAGNYDELTIDMMNEQIVTNVKNSQYIIDRTKDTINLKYNKPWWNSTCSKYVAKRRQARRVFLSHPTDVNRQNWRLWENKTKKYILRCKEESWRSYVNSLNSKVNSKVIFKKINSLRGKANYSTITLQNNNSVITDPRKKQRFLQNIFFMVLMHLYLIELLITICIFKFNLKLLMIMNRNIIVILKCMN